MTAPSFLNLTFMLVMRLNHRVNLEKRITLELKLLTHKEMIDKSTFKGIKLVGSRPGILYGLGKIHEETCNGIPPFCPILSATGTPTYKLAKVLVKFLTLPTANEFTVIDYFTLLKKFVNRIPTYIWLVWTLNLYLLIFPQRKPLIFALRTCTMTIRISLTSQSMIFVICLT